MNLRRRQLGFTLIELLVALAVGGMILPMIATSIFQWSRLTTRMNGDFVIQLDIDTASYFIQQDLSQARTTVLPDDSKKTDPSLLDPMRVDWTDETGWATPGAASHSAEYYLLGTNLMRKYDGTTSIVGRYVESIEFARTLDFISVTIKSTLGVASQSHVYSIKTRPAGALQ